MPSHPYQDLPPQSFWRTGVSEAGVQGYQNFWTSKWDLPQNARFSTYGSCFAQHISRELRERKMDWVNAEQAPKRTPEDLALAYNFGVFSSRTGNIYTTRQLLVWAQLATDPSSCDAIETWETNGRFYDSLRPAIEPDGFASPQITRASRLSAAKAFRRSVEQAQVFVFTLGLTEGWENRETGQVYAMCPGTIAGTFDADLHAFENYKYPAVIADLEQAIDLMRRLNPDLKILLTVSPVPLTATASGAHVLSATTYSKSVLRSVAGDLAQEHAFVDYFPSFEVISGTPTQGQFYDANMRSVARTGVDVVMQYFFGGLRIDGAVVEKDTKQDQRARMIETREAADDLVCEEMALEHANAG